MPSTAPQIWVEAQALAFCFAILNIHNSEESEITSEVLPADILSNIFFEQITHTGKQFQATA